MKNRLKVKRSKNIDFSDFLLLPVLAFLIIEFQSLKGFASNQIPTDIQKIALVIGAPKEATESTWGHSFLRLSSESEFSSDDWSVEFSADEAENISYLKGLGIGSSYKLNIEVRKYRETSYNYTHVIDRDLYFYELNLSREEINKFVKLLNQRVETNKKDSYNFLFNNCTTGISEIIEEATQLQISGLAKNIPTWLPDKLREKNLIKTEFVVLGQSSIRNKIVDKYFDPLFERYLSNANRIKEYFLIYSLKKQLKSSLFEDRIVAYLKFAYLFKNQTIDIETMDFAKRLMNYEPQQIKGELLSLLNLKREETYTFLPLSFGEAVELREPNEEIITEEKITNKRIKIGQKDGKEYLEFLVPTVFKKINVKGQAEYIKKTHHFSSDQFAINHEKLSVTVHNELVELIDEDGKLAKLNIQNYTIYPDVIEIRGKKYLLPIFLLENLASFHLKKDFGSIHVLNKATQNSPFGNCYALVYLQKKLMENAYFNPLESVRAPTYYHKLIYQALHGSKVVVPGLKNISEWSKMVSDEKMQGVINEVGLQVAQFSDFFVQWFQRESMDSSRLNKIIHYVRNGKYPILTFIPYPGYQAEHALLLYDIQESENDYILYVYDPNFGLIPRLSPMSFKISKSDFKLSTNVYRNAVSDSLRVNFISPD